VLCEFYIRANGCLMLNTLLLTFLGCCDSEIVICRKRSQSHCYISQMLSLTKCCLSLC